MTSWVFIPALAGTVVAYYFAGCDAALPFLIGVTVASGLFDYLDGG